MTLRPLKFLLTVATCFSLQSIFLQQIYAAEVCTPPPKPIKYTIRSGEDFYSVLKNFGLDPVIGAGGSLERLQKMNNMPDQSQAENGTEILMPIKCEEKLLGWRIIDRGAYRLITSEKLDQNNSSQAKVNSETLSPDKKTVNILNKDIPDDNQVDLEKVDDSSTDVSDALRYRMICNGEWTGTECITRYSALFVTGSAWYDRYDGVDRTTGGEGTLLSKLNPEVGFGWNNYWNSHFRTDLNTTIMNNDIHPEVRERPIEQSKKILNSFTFDARYELGKWGIKGGISQRERLFYRFAQSNIALQQDGGVVVNAVPVMDLHIGISYMVHQSGKFRFDLESNFSSLQSAGTSGYNVRPGNSYDLAGTIQHDRVKEFLFGTVKYEVSQQDTDILLQKTVELGFKFGYAWKLKDW